MDVFFRVWWDALLIGLGITLISGAVTGTIYTNPRGGHRVRKPLLHIRSKPARVAALLVGTGSLICGILRLATHW
jgi:hypothetical protein